MPGVELLRVTPCKLGFLTELTHIQKAAGWEAGVDSHFLFPDGRWGLRVSLWAPTTIT